MLLRWWLLGLGFGLLVEGLDGVLLHCLRFGIAYIESRSTYVIFSIISFYKQPRIPSDVVMFAEIVNNFVDKDRISPGHVGDLDDL